MPAIHILHVEDDLNDAFLVRRALGERKNKWTVMTVTDGDQAVDYLSGLGEFADRKRYPFPDLILLDLKLPSMHGFDLLAWMRAHPQLQRLPIIVLSGSGDDTDRSCAHELGASSYFVKTPLYEGLAKSVECLLGRTPLPALDPLAGASSPAMVAWSV